MWSADEEQRRWRLSWVTRKLLLSGSTPGATTAAIGRLSLWCRRWPVELGGGDVLVRPF
ncbi:hypothetical protein LINGRAHAP2_LOCUS7645 [Linum grandiflorum]